MAYNETLSPSGLTGKSLVITDKVSEVWKKVASTTDIIVIEDDFILTNPRF